MQSTGVSSLIIASLSAAIVALAIPIAETQAARSVGLCGVAFHNGEYQFEDTSGRSPLVVMRKTESVIEQAPNTVVMRFDAPADVVDFVARTGRLGAGRLRSELVAYDDFGRVVDRDSGPARAGEGVTMQVATDSPVIREVRFRFEGSAVGGPVEIRELEVGSNPHFCTQTS